MVMFGRILGFIFGLRCRVCRFLMVLNAITKELGLCMYPFILRKGLIVREEAVVILEGDLEGSAYAF